MKHRAEDGTLWGCYPTEDGYLMLTATKPPMHTAMKLDPETLAWVLRQIGDAESVPPQH
jgi:hypothetical protein